MTAPDRKIFNNLFRSLTYKLIFDGLPLGAVKFVPSKTTESPRFGGFFFNGMISSDINLAQPE